MRFINIHILLDAHPKTAITYLLPKRDSKVSRSNKKKPSSSTNKNFIVISDNLTKHFYRLFNEKKVHFLQTWTWCLLCPPIALEMPIITYSQLDIIKKHSFRFSFMKINKNLKRKILIWRIPVLVAGFLLTARFLIYQ